MRIDLTKGSMLKNLIRFSVPYLLSCFLQTFYGLADLFLIGRFHGADAITAVSVGSQITHMLTVVIVGVAMGTSIAIGRAVGARRKDQLARTVGNTVTLFAVFAVILTILLLLCLDGAVAAVSTPKEAVGQAKEYLRICFLGVPFITAYNVISGMFRGMGDSKTPMYFVALAGVINVVLDYVMIGPLGMGAAGAALATVIAQGLSALMALLAMRQMNLGFHMTRRDLRPEWEAMSGILRVGIPIAAQDGFIQVSFLVITAIANSRGVEIAAAVGIVEKLISFFFLVPSSMLSSVSAIASQNVGAGQYGQGRKALGYGVAISVCYGLMIALACQLGAEALLGLFAREEPEVIRLGGQYLRAYVFDCSLAGIHFCFSGYFCAYGKAMLSFVHNLMSIVLIRIPGAYLMSLYFPDSLYPMGWAAPAGSLLSALVCGAFYVALQKKAQKSG